MTEEEKDTSAGQKPTLGQFSLVAQIRKPRINGGEVIEIDVNISGLGGIPTDNKLHISYPASILKADKKGRVGVVETRIMQLPGGILTGTEAIENFEQDIHGSTFTLTYGFFRSMRKIEITDNRILGEINWDDQHPIFIQLNTKSDAPPGDHQIMLTLSYSDEKDNKMDQKHVVIHVNTWIEKHQKVLQWIAGVVGFIALISGLIQTKYTVLQYLQAIGYTRACR